MCSPSILGKAFFLTIFLYCSGAAGDVLYEVDFSDPRHVVGSGAYTDTRSSPRIGPSRTTGEDRQFIRSSIGPLSTKCLELPADGSSLFQVEYELGSLPHSDYYTASFDLYLGEGSRETAFGVFNVNFDTPFVSNLTFYADGRITRHQGAGVAQIGQVSLDQIIHTNVFVNLAENLWSINVNEENLFNGIFFRPYPAQPEPTGDLTGLRMTYFSDNLDTRAGVDNIRISAIPEPAAVCLLALGGVGLMRRKRTR